MEIRETPNPNVRQFLPGGLVAPSGSVQRRRSFFEEKEESVVWKLFQCEDIQEVFFGYDFFTIQGLPTSDWKKISSHVLEVLKDEPFPIVFSSSSSDSEDHSEDQQDDERGANEVGDALAQEAEKTRPLETDPVDNIIYEIQCLFEERVQPAVAMDGGEILFKSFKDGIVYVEMRGACSGCPQSSATLKGGIERLLQYYIPEVVEIRIEGEGEEEAGKGPEDPLRVLDDLKMEGVIFNESSQDF